MVNTSQSGQLEILSGSFCFCGGLICCLQVFICSYIVKRKKNEMFRPCQGYSSGGLWLGRCLVIDFCRLHLCRWFRCCDSNLIIGSFHRLRLGFIFMSSGHFSRCVLNLKTLALTFALQSRHLIHVIVFFFHDQGLNKSSIQDL